MQKKKYYKKIISYFSKNKKLIAIYFFTTIITLGTSTLNPLIYAKQISAITNLDFSDMIKISGIILIIAGINELVGYYNRASSDKLQNNVSLAIKSDISKDLFNLETKNFDKEGTGFFSSRIEGEPRNISGILFTIRYQLTSLVTGSGIYIYIFIISPYMGIFFTMSSIITFLIRYRSIKIWEKRRKEINELDEKYSGNFYEIIRGIRDIKVLNLKNYMINKTVNEQKDYFEKEFEMDKVNRKFDIFRWIVEALTDFSFIIFGIFLIKQNLLAGANLLVLFMYRYQAFGFIGNFSDIIRDFKAFNLSVERLYEVIDGDKYPKEKYGDINIKRIHGDIEFRNVNYAYEDDKLVLKDTSFKINANETIGIVGKSGQGKTTIFNLLSKLYSTTDNQIFIDGIDINKLDEKTIRNSISVITQSPYIFNLTIKENLKMVKPNITDKEMIEKCKLCALHDFVMTLEKGYDTRIGENGVILSGGQKQRLAIARALIKDSEIILLDEATSSLDNETQDFIQESIHKISSDYTIIIIAHRLSTIKNCNRILVVDDGKIVGDGPHNKLIKDNKNYQKLYSKEFQ